MPLIVPPIMVVVLFEPPLYVQEATEPLTVPPFNRSAMPVFDCVAVRRSNRAAVQEEITTVNLDRNEVVLSKAAALDVQAGYFATESSPTRTRDAPLTPTTPLLLVTLPLKRQPAVALNVDDIVREKRRSYLRYPHA